MEAVLIYIDDWLSSTKIASMDAAEERGYLRLLLHEAKQEDCGLPDEDNTLASLSGLDKQWFKLTRDPLKRVGEKTSGVKLRECFFLRDGRLYNSRLLKEWERFTLSRKERSETGKKGADSRWHGKANGSAMAQPLADASDSQCLDDGNLNLTPNLISNGTNVNVSVPRGVGVQAARFPNRTSTEPAGLIPDSANANVGASRGVSVPDPSVELAKYGTDAEILRRILTDFMEGKIAPPTDRDVLYCLRAGNGATAGQIGAYLHQVWKQGQRAGSRTGPQNYNWFAKVIASHFRAAPSDPPALKHPEPPEAPPPPPVPPDAAEWMAQFDSMIKIKRL